MQASFAVRVEAVVVDGRQVDLVLTCLPEMAAKWSAEEVAWRWLDVFPGGKGGREKPGRRQFTAWAGSASRIAEWRKRLTSVSWFMRAFNEWLARRINVEEETRGQVWDGRFYCRKLERSEVREVVDGLTGVRIPVPALQKGRRFPGLSALPDEPGPVRRKKSGRKSKERRPWLTVEQKIEVSRRLAKGEEVDDLAAEFARSPATIAKLKPSGRVDAVAIAGRRLTEVEKQRLRKLVMRTEPHRATNGRLVFRPNDIHSFAEETFGRKLYFEQFVTFCRELGHG